MPLMKRGSQSWLESHELENTVWVKNEALNLKSSL